MTSYGDKDTAQQLFGDRTGQALPEPRRVKREMLRWQWETQDAAAECATNPNAKTVRQWKKCMLRWYQIVQQYVDKYSKSSAVDAGMDDLRGLDRTLRDPTYQLSMDELVDYGNKLDELMYRIGVTAIGVQVDDHKYGYEFLNGLPNYGISTSDAGYTQLKQNVRNMRDVMREDVDFLGLITGGNRLGKTILAMRLARVAKSGKDDACLDRSNFAFTREEFFDHSEELGQYGVILADDWSNMVYSGDAMKGEQTKLKKLLKQYAKRNQFVIGTDTQYYKTDKEVLGDKMKWNIHVTGRGTFEFYSKAKINQFEKSDKDGRAIRPDPNFEGRFDDIPRSDPDRALYDKVEDEKIVDHGDGGEDEGREFDPVAVAEQAQGDARFWKEYNGSVIPDTDAVKAYDRSAFDLEIGTSRADQVKSVMKDIGPSAAVEAELLDD